MKRIAAQIFAFFASFGLACLLLLLLLLLTYLGTLEQGEHGLYEVQRLYFESLFFIHEFAGKVPVPLPGAYLVLALLSANLICGGIVRIRKRTAVAGVLICHIGILLLIGAGFVKFKYSVEGRLTLFEQDSGNEFLSYFEWEITVAAVDHQASDSAPIREYVIASKEFADLDGRSDGRTFALPELPFDLRVTDFFENCEIMPKGPMFAVDTPVIDGYFARVLPTELESELNVAGACIEIRPRDGGEPIPGLLHALEHFPFSVEMDGKTYAIAIGRRRWLLPFEVRLAQFHRELHPGTSMAAAFKSDVVKIESGHETRVTIEMNEPLRQQGFTLYQASWGPENAAPGTPLFSTLAVSRNPSDQWPLYACIIIAAGLLIHFSSKLYGYLRATAQRRAS